MQTLYKYLPSKYLNLFIERGELIFRSLAYFKYYEEQNIRGDFNEGNRNFKPYGGLEITKNTGENLTMPWAFESSVKVNEIFVHCMSLQKSSELANEFNADVCIEILNPVILISKIRSALAIRHWVKNGRLIHGPVDYYSQSDPPLAEWAVPERMIMRKFENYSYQNEYRFAFGRGDVFDLYNVNTQIVTGPQSIHHIAENHNQHTLKLGKLSNICRVHYF